MGGQKVPAAALAAEKKYAPKPVANKKKVMAGATCGSRPPRYQAACYRMRGQKVPAAALAAEKKYAPKPVAKKIKIAVKKPVLIKKKVMAGATCGSRPPKYQAACYGMRGQKV